MRRGSLIRAVVFDFGNVIGFFDHRRATRRFAEFSAMSESEMFAAIYDGELEHEFEAGRLSGDEFLNRATQLIDYRGLPDFMAASFVDIFTPNPPVCALIPRLKPACRLVLGS